MKPKAAPAVTETDDVTALETEWADGLTAKMTRQTFPKRELAPGLVVEGAALETDLLQHGVLIGSATWFPRQKVYTWFVVGLMTTPEAITESSLAQKYGGWVFTPDSSWMNLQLIATHHFKTEMLRRGSVAAASPLDRLAQLISPVLHANEPGCDYMHYLDGTFFRDCCDDHDRCYVKDGCDMSSWWTFRDGWGCNRCNQVVYRCFVGVAIIDWCLTRLGLC